MTPRMSSDYFGAGGGNRTHMASLEGWNFTIKLHPRNFCDYREGVQDCQFWFWKKTQKRPDLFEIRPFDLERFGVEKMFRRKLDCFGETEKF